MAGSHVSPRACGRSETATGMRGIDEPHFYERPVRHHVQCADVSRLVFETEFTAGLRVSPAFLAAFAATAKCAPLGLKSARAHVRLAQFVIHLSRRPFCPSPSRTTSSYHFRL